MITENHKLVYGLSAVFWGYANFVLVGYFKDVEADRATGYNTFLVVFGRRLSSIASNIFGVLTILSVIFVFSYSNSLERLLEQSSYSDYNSCPWNIDYVFMPGVSPFYKAR